MTTRQDVAMSSPLYSAYLPTDAALPPWRSHLLSVRQFKRADLDEVIFRVTNDMQTIVGLAGKVGYLSGKVLVCLFYEASSRTSGSFTAAIERLGGSTIPVNDVKFSSVSKGESLPDTIRNYAGYTDAIVLRHPEQGAAAVAAAAIDRLVRIDPSYKHVPIINAGDGPGEHPTQALLDLYTIQKELGGIDGKVVTMVGDLKHGRTVHSLARLLAEYQGVSINFVSPDNLKMPPAIIAELREHEIRPVEYDRLDEVVPKTDVLYVTRIQRERFDDQSEYEAVAGMYRVTPKTLELAKPAGQMVVMHPLPRVEGKDREILDEVDDDPRAAYFRQSRNGMHVRMAILACMMRNDIG